jgi:hypothetical protein
MLLVHRSPVGAPMTRHGEARGDEAIQHPRGCFAALAMTAAGASVAMAVKDAGPGECLRERPDVAASRVLRVENAF